MKEQKILLRKLRKSLIDISMLMYDLIYSLQIPFLPSQVKFRWSWGCEFQKG